LEIVNDLINQISEKLNEIDMEKAKSEIAVVYQFSYKLDKKSKPFSRLINEEVLKELSKKSQKFFPREIRLDARKGKEKPKGVRISISVRREKKLLKIDKVEWYSKQFPTDVVNKAIESSRELFDTALTSLMREDR